MDGKQEKILVETISNRVIEALSGLSLGEIEGLAEKSLQEQRAKDRRKKIDKRTVELLTAYSSAHADDIKTYRSLIEHLAFIDVMLKEYQDDIVSYGYQIKYQNGKNQWGIKRSEAVDLFKKWYSERLSDSSRLKQILGIEPDAIDDDFEIFMRGKLTNDAV